VAFYIQELLTLLIKNLMSFARCLGGVIHRIRESWMSRVIFCNPPPASFTVRDS
jgi:hypothetical protein